MIGETTTIEMLNLSDATFSRSETIKEDEICKQRLADKNHEQPMAKESCTERYVGILAAGLNSISG
jgi:hypothetical protein